MKNVFADGTEIDNLSGLHIAVNNMFSKICSMSEERFRLLKMKFAENEQVRSDSRIEYAVCIMLNEAVKVRE